MESWYSKMVPALSTLSIRRPYQETQRSNELQIIYEASQSFYAIIYNSSNQIWNTTGTPGFVSQVQVDWADYAVALTETAVSSGRYVANLPASADGNYQIWFYLGSSPATTDPLIGVAHWLGQIGDSLDATMSSRLASASYTAPANSDISDIKDQTDQLVFVGDEVKATVD